MALSRAEESVYVITYSVNLKGKRNGGPEAPKLRNHVRAEILEQRVYCVTEKESESKSYLKFCEEKKN